MRARRYDSIRSLSAAVFYLTNNGDVDQARRLIHDFVERTISESLCTSQVFGSEMLDDLCQRIGKANLTEVTEPTIK